MVAVDLGPARQRVVAVGADRGAIVLGLLESGAGEVEILRRGFNAFFSKNVRENMFRNFWLLGDQLLANR